MMQMTRFVRWLVALFLACLPIAGRAFELPILYADIDHGRILSIDPLTGNRVTLSEGASDPVLPSPRSAP